GVGADLSALEFNSKVNEPDWAHWSHAEGYFDDPCRSFNPICRLSPRLIAVILEFRRIHKRFLFQEVLFASLAAAHGLSVLDWRKDEKVSNLFENFRFRPEISQPCSGVCHPVKDEVLHRQICVGA